MKKFYKLVFKIIKKKAALSAPDAALMWDGDLYKPVPSTKFVQLCLWLYTIEPPIYAHFDKVCRTMAWKKDPKIFQTLGPYAAAMRHILTAAESQKKVKQGLQR